MSPATASPPEVASPAPAGERRRSPLASPLVLGLGGLAAVALLVAALALMAPGSGAQGGGPSGGPLVWKDPPRLYVAPANPRDRIITGTVRNDSVRVAEVRAEDVAVLSESGDRLQSAAIFLGSFSRGLYGASRRGQASDIEQRRTGRLLRIGPGGEQPLTVSWRLRSAGKQAARIEYGAGSLPAAR